MWTAIIDLIGGIFKPAADLVDDLHTSEEEKLIIKSKLFEMEKEVTAKALELEKETINAQKEIIIAEAQGGWLQRNWRPVLMWMIMFIIMHNFILVPYIKMIWPEFTIVLDLPDWMGNLLTLGVGGYVVGRSGEKIVTKWKTRNDI